MVTKNPGTEIQIIFVNYKSCPVKSNCYVCCIQSFCQINESRKISGNLNFTKEGNIREKKLK